jgi:hypothetical protein
MHKVDLIYLTFVSSEWKLLGKRRQTSSFPISVFVHAFVPLDLNQTRRQQIICSAMKPCSRIADMWRLFSRFGKDLSRYYQTLHKRSSLNLGYIGGCNEVSKLSWTMLSIRTHSTFCNSFKSRLCRSKETRHVFTRMKFWTEYQRKAETTAFPPWIEKMGAGQRSWQDTNVYIYI